MTDCNIDGLQSTHTNSAFREVGVRINSNGRKSYDVTEEEIRRSREYYDKTDAD